MATNAFFAGIHAMPYTNHCQHCWVHGTPKHEQMLFEQLRQILKKTGSVTEKIPYVTFILYDEPTTHPQFLNIMETASQERLISEQFFLPTNDGLNCRSRIHAPVRIF